MTEYLRPRVAPMVFRDESGEVVEYGTHWADREGTPPEDSYSVVSHPERFAPLHTVATALIDHLVAAYDVEREEGQHVTEGLLHPPTPEETVRAVRLTPRSEACAPLVIVLTAFPGVRLYAGVLFSEPYPSCGCDACDERWEPLADELEWETFSIVGGGFAEDVSEPRRATGSYDHGHGLVKGMGQTVSYRLRALDGESQKSGQSRAEDVPAALLRRAGAQLEAVAAASPDGTWLPWPARARVAMSEKS